MTTEPTPPDQLAPQDDYIDGPGATILRGRVIEYEYSRGTRYRLAFDQGSTVEFSVVSHAGSDASRPGTPPPLEYRAREIRPGMVLLHWLVKPAAIHVTLLFDFEQQIVHVAAMMPPNRWEFFDVGRIVSVSPAP